MERVGVAELKARLSAYLARVKAGEEILIAERGRPVARLVPVLPSGEDEEEARLQDLERRGIVRRGTGQILPDYWDQDLPLDPQAAVRAALKEERSEGW